MTSIPPRGHFEWQVLVGTHMPDPGAMLDDRGYFGLVPEATFLYGMLHDDEGELYNIVRRIPANNDGILGEEVLGGLKQFVVQSTLHDDPCLHVHPATIGCATSDGALGSLEGQEARWESMPGAEGRPFRITFQPDRCTWVEEESLDLTGTLVGPGLHWYLPGRDLGMYYVSQLYEVQATLLDRPARGFIGFDQCYMVEGGELYNRKDIVVGEGIEVLWHTWAHRYDDGTVEAGHFALGHERFGFALFTNQDRQVVATTDIDGEVVRNDDGSVATIRANVAGEPWEFLPDPRGTMPDYGEVPNPQILGRWRRVGDNRTAISWLAWGETAPGHGDRPRR